MPSPGIPAVLALDRLDPYLPALLATLALAAVVALWRVRSRLLKRAARRRAAGYRLMDCLKAYTAWVDWHRDEPLLHRDPENLDIPAALAQAVQVKDEHFPELSRFMLQLLQTHRELMQYLWEENILRMTHAGQQRPYYADPRYHQLRDTQDAALDTLFLRCRELIGEKHSKWRNTRSDFSFSSGMETPSPPA
jgi:Trm5-related predicted tRNA methylase